MTIAIFFVLCFFLRKFHTYLYHEQLYQLLLHLCVACNVAYLGSFNVESLTGHAALKYAVSKIEPGGKNKEHEPVLVNFKVNKQGITLTDNERK